MAVSKVGVIAAVVMCMVVVSQHVEVVGALTCGQVTGALTQCLGYLLGKGVLQPLCCDGVKNLNNLARSTPDRQQACVCLKKLAASVRGLNYALASSLPGKCGVSIPYQISPSTDCTKVK